MKKTHSKITALLLSAAMLLSLAACGQALPEEIGGDDAAVLQEPEELTYHIYEQTEALARETVKAAFALPESTDSPVWGPVLDRVTEYSYDLNGGQTATTAFCSPDESGGLFGFYGLYGEEREGWTYEYDASGGLIRVSSPAGTAGGLELVRVSDAENGRPVKNVITVAGNVDPLCVCEFSYNGRNLAREERTVYADMGTGRPLGAPVKDIYEFDDEGHVIRWERKTQEGGHTVSYEYEPSGGLERKITERSGRQEIQDIVRDESGRVLKTVVTQADGKVITHSFAYDSAGRILSDTVTGGKKKMLYELAYGKDGWPATMKIYENGNKVKTEKYSFDKQSENRTVGKAKVTYSEADIFGGSSYVFSWPEGQSAAGDPLYQDSYELAVTGTRIRYVRSSVRREYRLFPKLYDVSAGRFEAGAEKISSLEELYPELRNSYGDYPVPQPDGKQSLRRIVVDSDIQDAVGTTTIIIYDQKERPAGMISSFDMDFISAYEKADIEENGREISTSSGNWTGRYHFAEDMLSYTAVVDNTEYSYHSENEYRLAERLPAAVIAIRDNEEFHGYHAEYDGDGLLTRYGYSGMFEYNYSYSFTPDLHGKLSRIDLSGDEVPEGSVFMSFDQHGYLTRWTRILEHETITIDYFYVET